jgi:Ca-activated chloride channel family protein
MKQIILITDGCSNVGINPVIAASHALAEGIAVNVIGVIDQGEIGAFGANEIEQIARAGGGLSRIVDSRQLARTVQMMTSQTVTHTIRQIVGQELRQITGMPSIDDLPPDKRAQVVRVMDELAETAGLKIALLIDTSASMKPKLGAVEEAIRDLMASLQARTGVSELCVFRFPGKGGREEASLEVPWTKELAKITNLFYKLNMKGTTPTGPALLQAVQYVSGGGDREHPMNTAKADHSVPPTPSAGDGMLSDYII